MIVVNFNVPGVIFDFASFSFQVPICGSAAKHAAVAKKQNAGNNPIIRIFKRSIETWTSTNGQHFSELTATARAVDPAESGVGRQCRERLCFGCR
jgi:hypothetical protein